MPDLRRHPLLPALAAALLCQAALLALLRPSPSGSGQPRQTSQPADDTPELLRLSRGLLQAAAAPRPGLSQLLTLPLPPPPQLAASPPAPAGPAPVQASAARPRPPQAPASAAAPAAAKPAAAPAAAAAAAQVAVPPAGQLPSQPGQALAGAKAIASGPQALPAEGASPTQVALQRRQWWLSPQEANQLQQAWEQAEAAEAPDDWQTLPPAVQLRQVERRNLGSLAAGDPRGRSLVSREQITLIWGSGTQLWLLRLPFSG
jgi:hypothetical protein